jgi:L-rhamnose isomerase/sugar isomerase
MIQTVTTAQELFAKACLVDRNKLRDAQTRCNVVDAENCLKDAFATDVRPILQEWRKRKGIDPNPLEAYRASGYEARVAKEREERSAASGARARSSSFA